MDRLSFAPLKLDRRPGQFPCIALVLALPVFCFSMASRRRDMYCFRMPQLPAPSHTLLSAKWFGSRRSRQSDGYSSRQGGCTRLVQRCPLAPSVPWNQSTVAGSVVQLGRACRRPEQMRTWLPKTPQSMANQNGMISALALYPWCALK